MSSGVVRRSVRANRLDERQAVAIALVSGVVAALSNAAPTGSEVVDRPMVGIAVAAVTWAAASAPWWAVAAAAGAAAIAAIDPLLTLIGGLAFVGGLWIGVKRRDLGTARCLIGAVAMNVMCRAELEGFFGASAVIGITIGVILFVVGVRRRRRPIRRAAWSAFGAILCLAFLAVVGFAVSATSARALLSDGQRLATQGIDELGRGDFEGAAIRFAEAGRAFDRAHTHLERPWAVPSRLVPVVAQNAEAVRDLAEIASISSAELSSSLAAIDPDTLRLTDGRIDLAAVEAMSGPLQDVETSLDALDRTVADTDSPWLLAPIRTRIDRLAQDIDANEQPIENAVTAAELAPQMLGANGTRRYLIMFTTPAEARGLGGFMGNFAEIEATNGQLSVTRFGRTVELNQGGPNPGGRVVTGPPDWINQWGRYGFVDGVTGTTSAVPWSNVTMSPHFPSTAQVVAELYPQSGGRPVDGVFAVDPYAIAALMELTGPLDIASTGTQLSAANVVDFLLRDQYLIDDRPDRVDLLKEVSETTIDRLFSSSLPSPSHVADLLGPVVHQGRLVGWSANADEESLIQSVGMSGALPDLAGGDGVAVVVNNAAANKIDVYLERDVVYRATVDERSGRVRATVEVTLTNTAPSAGMPQVVIGNLVHEPSGTNRAIVSVYTGLPVVSVERNGRPIVVETGIESGWRTVRTAVTIPSGGVTTLVLELEGSIAGSDTYRLALRPQPLVIPESFSVEVQTMTGSQLVSFVGEVSDPKNLGVSQ